MSGTGKPSRRKRGRAKHRHKDAERAAEWFAREHQGCVVTVRAVKTQWQRQDLFACDCLGKRADGSLVCIQVTAGDSSNASPRRRKLEAIPWGPQDTVLLLQLTSNPNPANRRKMQWYFRVQRYECAEWGKWYWTIEPEAVAVPAAWFRAYSSEPRE